MSKYLDNRTVLITGGTGTVGQNLLIHILENYNVKSVIVFSRDEFKQHNLKVYMSTRSYSSKIKYIIGDIREYQSCYRAFKDVDIVFHSAAIKHVSIAEDNPMEAVKTNILGTDNVIQAAIDNKVDRVIGISTDKSVIPSNLYGSTKLTMEKLIINANTLSDTKFSVLRFGNILCSRGSVISTFLRLKESGKIRVTDPNVTRFTITIDQMVRFIIECAEDTQGGETFIPKLPAYSLGQLVNLICNDTEISIVGLGVGERLHEYMMSESESGTVYEQDTRYIVTNRDRTDRKVTPFLYSSENAEKIDDTLLLSQIEKYRDG